MDPISVSAQYRKIFNISICMNLQSRLTMAACSITCEWIQKVCWCVRDPKDPVKYQKPRAHCRVLCNLYQEAQRSAVEIWRVYIKRLKSLCWEPVDRHQGKGKDWSSSEETKLRCPSFLFYSIQATSLLVGAICIMGRSSVFSKSIHHTQNYSNTISWVVFFTQIE